MVGQPGRAGVVLQTDFETPGGNKDADVARTMQKICEASENNLQETNELVKELADWSHIMHHCLR
jgi:endonuclease III